MDECVEVAIERLHQERWWTEVEAQLFRSISTEVDVGPAHDDATTLPVPPIDHTARHVLGTRDESCRDRVQVLVNQMTCLRRSVQQAHAVCRAPVEHVPRCVVTLVSE